MEAGLANSCNELFLSVCCFDENNPSLTEIEAGSMQTNLSR